LTAGFGAKRARFAKAVMAGIEGGLSPERAVALATKRHGEQDPGADDGTQIAEAEGDSASDVGKEKVNEASRGGDKDTDAPDLEMRPEPGGGYGVYIKGALAGWSQTEDGAREILERQRVNAQSRLQRRGEGSDAYGATKPVESAKSGSISIKI